MRVAPTVLDPIDEVAALVATLNEAGRRLEELTGGEVDSVVDGDGRTFLLGHAQEQLRESEAAKEAAILNALPANLALLDAGGIIIAVNDAWREFGAANQLRSPGHGVGLDYIALCDRARGKDASLGPQVAAGIRSVLSGEAATFSIEYPCDSPGEPRWFLMKASPLAGGQGAVVMHVDLSKQRRAEESLRASEQRFRQMSESIRDVFFLLDTARERMLYLSPAYEAISGRSCESVYADPQAWYDAIHPEDRESAREAAAIGMASGREYEHESRFIGADGSIRWMAVRGFPVHEEGETLQRMAGAAKDITHLKLAQEELERTHRHLVEASRRAGMAEVATNILHNVGNVLNSVNTSATLALDAVRESRSADLARVVTLMRDHASDLGTYLTADAQGRHIPAMLEELSGDWNEQQRGLAAELGSLRTNVDHVKRIIAVQQGYARVSDLAEAVDLRELIEDGLRMTADDALGGQLEVTRNFAPIAPVTAEKHKVLQILVNLLSNARQACAASGRPECRITVSISEAGGKARVAVADNGTGIAAENLVRIFAHGFTTRKDGHGFGLHSGALAAAELGGQLRAHSDGPGLGATFTLELPAGRSAGDA